MRLHVQKAPSGHWWVREDLGDSLVATFWSHCPSSGKEYDAEGHAYLFVDAMIPPDREESYQKISSAFEAYQRDDSPENLARARAAIEAKLRGEQ